MKDSEGQVNKRKPEDNDQTLTAPKKRKVSSQKYKELYSKLWPCLIASIKGDIFVRCTVCDVDFSCAHAGKNDCKRHIETKQHRDLKTLKATNKSMTLFCSKGNASSETETKIRSITRAEIMMCELITDLNLPLATTDHFAKSLKLMFPDSKIAAGMKCGRNKATAMLKELSKLSQGTLGQRMKNNPFSISTDGSNDAKSKQYPLVVRTFDTQSGSVNSELLSVPICSGSSTGENIFKLINEELSSYNIPWGNCLSLGCDNANVMTGNKKGVYAFVKEKQPQVFLSGCCLHLTHIAAKKGAEHLPPIDDVLIDIYYFFNKSDKRQSDFKGTQELFDQEQKRMLKHVCTRWLSIGRCLERLLFNWDALKVYFKDQSDKIKAKQKSKTEKKKSVVPSRKVTGGTTDSSKAVHSSKDIESVQFDPSYAEKKIEAILKFIRSPTNKLYVLFLNYTVHVYDDVLKNLQAEEPKIHCLRRALQSLLRNILVRFVKPSAVSGTPVDKVQYKLRYNQKEDSELVIGEAAREFIASKDSNLKQNRIAEFYVNVRQYFTTVCDYLINKLPLDQPLLRHAEIADVNLQLSSKSSSLEFFLERFPCLLPEGITKDEILEEFVTYQAMDAKECMQSRMDETWNCIGHIKDENCDLVFQFANLAKVMCGILCIPHSSAHCERVFSTVRKNRTDQRASLNDDTLEALLVLKSRPGNVYDSNRQHSNETLDQIKGAYYRHLNH